MLTPFISQNTWTKHSITPPRSFDRGGTFASGNMKKSSIAKSCESRNCSENVLVLLMVDDLLGDVSGAIRATPSAEAAR